MVYMTNEMNMHRISWQKESNQTLRGLDIVDQKRLRFDSLVYVNSWIECSDQIWRNIALIFPVTEHTTTTPYMGRGVA